MGNSETSRIYDALGTVDTRPQWRSKRDALSPREKNTSFIQLKVELVSTLFRRKIKQCRAYFSARPSGRVLFVWEVYFSVCFYEEMLRPVIVFQ